MKNKGDYHDHYLKKDALLLADVCEKFIDTCLKYYGLDPYDYLTCKKTWNKFEMKNMVIIMIII